MLRRALLITIVAGLIAVFPGAAAAAVTLAIHPTRTDDPASGGTTCSVVAANNTDCSLRSALALAGNGVLVSLAPPAPPGPYVVSRNSGLEIVHNLTLQGLGARTTTIERAANIEGKVLSIDSSATAATVADLTITGGSDPSGSGIFNLGGLTLKDSAIVGNGSDTGGNVGGGIESDGTLRITGSIVSDNFAEVGAGIAIVGGTAEIVNTTIADNGSGPVVAEGGGLAALQGTVDLANVTLAGNSALLGGQGGNAFINSAATVVATDTIIADGAASDGGTENCQGTIVSHGYNVEDRAQCGLAGAGDQTGVDPQLGLLLDDGGPTDTMAPALDGPATDHGNPNGCTDPGGTLLSVDQRGMTRPEGLSCDVGAYELQPVEPDPSLATIVIGTRGATLNGTIDTHGFPTSWHFEYGPTTTYSFSTTSQTLLGGTDPVSVAIAGLSPGSLYHVRLVASTSAGTSATADAVVVTAPEDVVGTTGGGVQTVTTGGSAPGAVAAPTLSRLSIRPSRFRVGGHGASVSYADSQPATSTFVVTQLGAGRRKRAIVVGRFTHRDRAGTNRVPLGGRVGGRRLAPGRYRLSASPQMGARTGRTVSGGFSVVR